MQFYGNKKVEVKINVLEIIPGKIYAEFLEPVEKRLYIPNFTIDNPDIIKKEGTTTISIDRWFLKRFRLI